MRKKDSDFLGVLARVGFGPGGIRPDRFAREGFARES